MIDYATIRKSLAASKSVAEKPISGKLTGKITDIQVTTAGDVYGSEAKDPDREVINVRVEVDQTGDRFKMAFTSPIGRASWTNPTFKLALFCQRYGDLPDIGMPVDVEVTNGGHYNIIL